MMDQLGIKALRPGPSGNEKAPNHANYDESKANPFPNLPDPLTLNDGHEGDDGEDVVGQAAAGDRGDVSRSTCMAACRKNVPKVTWTVNAVDHEMIGFTPVIART